MSVRLGRQTAGRPAIGGWAGWFMKKLGRTATGRRARLELVERIQLAPRQSLALVEADGRRFLVASSAEGSPVFYPVGGEAQLRRPVAAARRARTSW